MAYSAGCDVLNRIAKHVGVPKECSRMVIDIPCDGAVTIYYQCVGDDATLDVTLDAVLDVAGVDVVRVGEPEKGANDA